MILTHKIRSNPGAKAQAAFLWTASRVCTSLLNLVLDQRTRDSSLTVYQQKRELPKLKKGYPEFKKPSSQVLQNIVFLVDRS